MKAKIPDYAHLSSHLGHIPKIHISPKALWEEFKNFAFKGNLVDMAVAVVIGAAFSAVVKSMVDNVVMPGVTRMLPTSVKFEEWHLGPILYGKFMADVIHFLIVAATVFI